MKHLDKNTYLPEDIKIARVAKALGHPARIAILRYIAALDTCRFTDISNELSLANSTVYQHLAELKRAGLIQGCIDPQNLQYCINYENWQLFRKNFKALAEIRIAKYEKSNEPQLYSE
jgi:DNA-binding transcriptional ArsR family regulator